MLFVRLNLCAALVLQKQKVLLTTGLTRFIGFFIMAYRSRFSARRFGSRYGRRVGTRFVGKRYSNRSVPGREVPYYLPGGSEAHVMDVALPGFPTPTSADTNVASVNLNLITRGNGIFDRESIRASMKYILMRFRIALVGTVFPNTSSNLPVEPVTVRLILVYTTRPVASQPPVSDFLTVPGGSTALFATSGVQRIDSRESYQILYDNKFVIRNTNGATTTGAGQILRPEGDFTFRDVDVRLPVNRSVSFTSSSTTPITPSDVTSGLLTMYTLVDNVYYNANQFHGVAQGGSCRLVFSP